MDRWDDFLIITQLDDRLCDGLRAQLGPLLTDDMRDAIFKRLESKADISNIRKILKDHRLLISSELAHDINDALREVSSGIEYVRTDLGKTVLTINRWMSPWHTQSLRGNPAFEGIMIGGNADDLFKIYVTGTISSDEVLDQLGELIVSHAPPFDVVYNVCVTGA